MRGKWPCLCWKEEENLVSAGTGIAVVREVLVRFFAAGEAGEKDAAQEDEGHNWNDDEGRCNNFHNPNPLTGLA